jgi:hypothetical protein
MHVGICNLKHCTILSSLFYKIVGCVPAGKDRLAAVPTIRAFPDGRQGLGGWKKNPEF